MTQLNRRQLLAGTGVLGAMSSGRIARLQANELTPAGDTLAMQLYKSLNDQQREKICLPINDQRRQFISNWWYVHREHRINNTFTKDQQALIQSVFDSFHTDEHRDAVNKQVQIDQYGQSKNAPSVGFFGTPEDDNFEFIFTGHHVTRRCNVHSHEGSGFGGAPIFYGHFPEKFNETKDHPGNPYWYQGKLFNRFVQSLSGTQQAEGLVSTDPRSERPVAVIKKREARWPGLACRTLSEDQKDLLIDTMRQMLAMFRSSDVEATLKSIRDNMLLDELYISWYGGKYDVGADRVWDTWQIEGPSMVWYFRGQPHIHSYFHVKA